MSIQRVEQQRNKSCVGNGIKCAAIGGAIGYASKWTLPLTSQEMDSDYRAILDHIKQQTVKSQEAHRDFIKSLRKQNVSQPSLDVFANSVSKNTKNNSALQYNLGMKAIRPALPFVGFFAAAGFLYSFVKNTLKTEVN